MGCQNTKDQNSLCLLCTFQTGNESQAAYCLKLRDNFHHEKTIRYEIKSGAQLPFSVKFKIRNTLHDIQNIFDDSENAMNQALQKIYDLMK